jgi:hypothetical protein
MKTSKLIALAMVALTLSFTPAMAQRGGGGGRSGGGHSSSSSMSRSSSSSPSRSSFSSGSSRSSSSYSSPSRSSSSSSRSSYSSPSRSSSSSVRSSSSPSRSSYSDRSRSSSSSSRSSFADRRRGSTGTPSRSTYGDTPRTRSSATRSGSDHREPMNRTGVGTSSRGEGVGSGARTRGEVSGSNARTRGEGSGAGVRTRGVNAPASRNGAVVNGRPSSNPGARTAGYARPGRPGPLPPCSRPIHPAPYFYHPWHGYVVHCHPIFWDPLPPRPWYWPGFWLYCNSYWYDYHVTDVVVVRQYVQDTYNVDMVTYGISGDLMYAIVRDGGETYLQVYDKDDHLIAEQKINRKYCNLVIDAESGGCWISKKHDKDPLLFLWSDGQLLIYEAD